MSTEYGPLWQLKQNLESKKAVVSSFDADIKRISSKIESINKEIKEYELAIQILESSLK